MTIGDDWRVVRFPDGDASELLAAKIVVDEQTMESRTEYYFGNERCRTVPLQSKRAQQLSGYAAIQKDLKFVSKAISLSLAMEKGAGNENDAYVIRAEADENADILKALYVSFIVTYGKCFVGAHRRRVKLEPKKHFCR